MIAARIIADVRRIAVLRHLSPDGYELMGRDARAAIAPRAQAGTTPSCLRRAFGSSVADIGPPDRADFLADLKTVARPFPSKVCWTGVRALVGPILTLHPVSAGRLRM